MKQFRFTKKKAGPRVLEQFEQGRSSAGGHADLTPGIYDRPGPNDEDDEIFELPSEVPINPSEQVATQLSTERPPVDDDEYVPLSSKELVGAVAELAKSIDDEKVHSFYKKFKAMIEQEVSDQEEKIGEPMSESQLRKKVLSILREAMEDEDAEYLRRQFEEEFGEEPEDIEEEPPPEEETSLKDIASSTGFAGPSGVKNFLYRLMPKVQLFSSIPDEEFDAIVEFAVDEFVDLLEQSGAVDQEDALFMVKNKSHVASLPSFRYFLFHAMIVPAAKVVEKTNQTKLRSVLTKMGIPDKTMGSIINQVLGAVPRNDSIIEDQFSTDVRAGRLTSVRAKRLFDEVSQKFATLQNVTKTSNFADIVLQKYASINKRKVTQILQRASEDPDVQSVAL